MGTTAFYTIDEVAELLVRQEERKEGSRTDRVQECSSQ